MKKSNLSKVICPCCGASTFILDSGKLKKHKERWRTAGSSFRTTCVYSGRKVAEPI